MMRARSACATLVACGLVAALAATAFAAGEQVDTTVTMKKGTAITKKKPGQLKLGWEIVVSKADGSRAANLSRGTLTLPKTVSANVAGMKPCPLAKLQANDNKSCPDESVVGSAEGSILSAPVRDEPYDSTGILYYTGGSATRPKFAAYWTLKEIPSAHSITTLSAAKNKVSFSHPRIPTAPGLPDATTLNMSFSFDEKGPKGYVFRTTKACKRGTAIKSTYGFYDGSSASGTGGTC